MSRPKRGRPPKTPETEGLMPWEEVAKRVGLSVKETKRLGEQALEKLKIELMLQGLDREYVREAARMREKKEN